jgi:hypothetical protein
MDVTACETTRLWDFSNSQLVLYGSSFEPASIAAQFSYG